MDRPQDLEEWRRNYRQGPGTVSVIIPALNEEARLGETLRAVGRAAVHQVIVVDGGSGDRTAELARKAGAEVVFHPPGRAGQLNRGAARASGEILLFLHADTILPPDYPDHIRLLLARPHTSAGAFSLALKGTHPGLRLIEGLAGFRCRPSVCPTATRPLFLTADTFWRAGGFPDQALMEDFELVRRLKKLGRIRIAPAPARTSARRWLKMGLLKTTLLNQLIILAYYLNISPDTLARLYTRRKGL